MKDKVFIVVGIACVLSIALPAILYAVSKPDSGLDNYGSCQVREEFRFKCDINQVEDWYQDVNNCTRARSCWNATTLGSKCYHSVPSGYQYYVKSDVIRSSSKALEVDEMVAMEIQPVSRNDMPLMDYKVELSWRTQEIFSLDFSSGDLTREPDLEEFTSNELTDGPSELEVNIPDRAGDFFYVSIGRRLEDGQVETIFDTRLGPTKFYTGNMTISTVLPSKHFYGIKGGQGNTVVGDLIVDGVTTFGQNELPFYMVREKRSGKMHGMLVETTHPFVAQIIEGPGIMFHFEGNIATSLTSMKIFVGPRPSDVLKQLSSYLEQKNGRSLTLPPYWALGLHLCRKTNSTQGVLEELDKLNRESSATSDLPPIPYDSDCISDRLRTPFKVNTGQFPDVSNLVSKLTAKSRHILPVQKLAVPTHAIEQALPPEIFIVVPNKTMPYQGVVDNETVYYPSIFNAKAQDWIAEEFDVGIPPSGYSGLILVDNLPRHENASVDMAGKLITSNSRIQSNFSSAVWGTPDPESVHVYTLVGNENASHLEVGNSYGHASLKYFEEMIVNSSASDTRSLLSTSTITSESFIYGAYNGLDVSFSWDGLRESLGHFLRYFMFAPFGGVPICGSWYEGGSEESFDQELCLRWFQVGLTLPFARNTYGDDNKNHSRGPADFNPLYQRHLIENIKDRYALSPYYYTQFDNYIKTGVPPIRPISFEFSNDDPEVTFGILDQFMVGSALLVAPVVFPGTSRSVYFPAERWYTLDGELAWDGRTSGMGTVSALIHHVPMFMRGNSVIPTLQLTSDSTLEGSRTGNYTILAPYPLANSAPSVGSLYLDDGVSRESKYFDSVEFALDQTEVRIVANCTGTSTLSRTINEIRLFDVPQRPSAVLNSATNLPLPSHSISYEDESGVLRLTMLDINWCSQAEVTLSWGNLWE